MKELTLCRSNLVGVSNVSRDVSCAIANGAVSDTDLKHLSIVKATTAMATDDMALETVSPV